MAPDRQKPTNIAPLFSIIVPIYNVKEYLGITIQSILEQTFHKFELLAIDDGSNDGSGELIDEIAKSDTRIRVFHQENSGVSAARNRGLDEAQGTWIVFVDGDDALRKNALESLADCIKRNPDADLIGYGSVHKKEISQEDLKYRCSIRTAKGQIFDCSSVTHFKALNHYVVWSEAFKRNILGSLRFEPLKNGEDVLFCNGIALRSNNYLELDEKLYIYRLLRKGGAYSNKWSIRVYNDFFMSQEGIFNNILSTIKVIDKTWIKRWVGGLLYYRSEINQFDKETRTYYFKKYRKFLINVGNLSDVPLYQKIWIKTATIFNSYKYFYVISMLPMRLYNNLRKLI